MSWRPTLSEETQGALWKSFISAFWVSAMFYSSSAFAALPVPNLQTWLENFATDVPNLMRLVTASAYVMGMFFVIAAVIRMKHFGELRMAMSREHSMWGALIELFAGIALLYLPTSVRTVMSTFWQSPAPYAYITSNTGTNATFVNSVYMVVQLIGTIALIRGLVMLKDAGSENSQSHVLGKAFSHILGGILCINIYGTIQMLEKTVGMIS